MKTIDYTVRGVDLGRIRNRNEARVLDRMEPVLDELFDLGTEILDIQDIYALALNLLPARYHQPEGITLHEPVSDDEVDEAIRQAWRRVHDRPNY